MASMVGFLVGRRGEETRERDGWFWFLKGRWRGR
jgi:hypothetical protein